MSCPESSRPATPARSFGLSPIVLGTGCCLVAALGYTAVDVGVRSLSERRDLVWILFVKELVAVALVGPWLVWQARRGTSQPVGRQALLTLAVVGALTQLAGNLPFFWAMRVVGLAITIPASLGVTLIASATFGWFFLRERVSWQTGLAIAMTIASVIFLSLGAGAGGGSPLPNPLPQGEGTASSPLQLGDVAGNVGPAAHGPFWIALAVAMACMAGVVYATLSLAIRHSATRGVSVAWMAFIIPLMGTITLGPLCLCNPGLQELLATPSSDLLLMALCGVLNLVAYTAIIKALQMTTMVHANVLNASQTAMAAAAGFLFFQESASPSLLAGVCLTMAGMVLLDRPIAA
jgi:drug/metabolite transporter, DME family